MTIDPDEVLGHWSFVYDFDSDWGGFASGEFALLRDGRLMIRTARGPGPNDPNQSSFTTWRQDPRFESTPSHSGRFPSWRSRAALPSSPELRIEECLNWLKDHRYGIQPASSTDL